MWCDKKLFTLLDLCVSSLRRGHANLLCIVPILTDDLRRGSNYQALACVLNHCVRVRMRVSLFVCVCVCVCVRAQARRDGFGSSATNLLQQKSPPPSGIAAIGLETLASFASVICALAANFKTKMTALEVRAHRGESMAVWSTRTAR